MVKKIMSKKVIIRDINSNDCGWCAGCLRGSGCLRQMAILKKTKTLNIQFYDNEDSKYPLIEIKEDDLDKFLNILKKYQKKDMYNYDDFLLLLRKRSVWFDEFKVNCEVFF